MRIIKIALCLTLALCLIMSSFFVLAEENDSKLYKMVQDFLNDELPYIVKNGKTKTSAWLDYSLSKSYKNLVVKELQNSEIAISFDLCPLAPNFDKLRLYAKKPDYIKYFWEYALKNTEDYNLSIDTSLIYNRKTDKLTWKTNNGFDVYKKIINASNKSKSDFSSNNIAKFISQRIIPSPVDFGTKRVNDLNNVKFSPYFKEYVKSYDFNMPALIPAVFYGISKFEIEIKSPENCTINIKTPNYSQLMSIAIEKSKYDIMSYDNPQVLEADDIIGFIVRNFEREVLSVKNKHSNDYSIDFNILKLNTDDDVWKDQLDKELIVPLNEQIQGSLKNLLVFSSSQAKYPVMSMPKTGSIHGVRKGFARCVFKKEAGDTNNYALIMIDSSGSAMDQGFINSKHKSCTLFVPKEEYTLVLASGEKWYGEKYLFGDTGIYIRSETISISNINNVYNFSISNSSDANICGYSFPLDSIGKQGD